MRCNHEWAGAAICELCGAKRCLDCETEQRRLEMFVRGRCARCHREHLEFLDREHKWQERDEPRVVKVNRGPNVRLAALERVEQKVSMLLAAGRIDGFRALALQAAIDKKRKQLQGLRFVISQSLREKERGQNKMPPQGGVLAQPIDPTFREQIRAGHMVVKGARPASTSESKAFYRGRQC